MERVAETYSGGPDCRDAANAYAEGKRAAETLCATAAKDSALRPRIARCFAFVGPRLPLDIHFAVGNFLRNALEGRDIEVKGDGTPLRSYLHAADLVAWLVTILVRGEPLRPYNVGSDEPVSIAELAHRVSHLPSPPVAVRILGKPGKEPLQRYVPSIERARSELGLAPWIGLEAALQRTFEWLRPQR
jgi:dTDP-glucose 4,6-dehydratase